jgi:sporulation protein YlmC with PRC-barrel domain
MTDPVGATTQSIVIEDIKDWRGQDVLDSQGEKLGKLEDVYYDTESDAPAFGAIKSGLVGKHITLVPLAGATAGQSYIRVRTAKERFKDAPSIDPETELTSELEAGSYQHFGLEYRPVGAGARRLAKH